jgi:signal transduction histidine kinase
VQANSVEQQTGFQRSALSASVIVEVADTGPGISPELLPQIWEPFYTTKPEGTGLGLAIVRSLVAEQPGASIDVESRPGEGTTFMLMLPVAHSGDQPPTG